MLQFRLCFRLILLALLGAASGCQFLHDYQTVTYMVRDAETKQPLAGAKIQADPDRELPVDLKLALVTGRRHIYPVCHNIVR